MDINTHLKRLSGFQHHSPITSRTLGPRDFQPRQFEYNPAPMSTLLAIGSCDGNVAVVDWNDNRLINKGQVSQPPDSDAVLTLSWLHSQPDLFMAGASSGETNLYRVDPDSTEMTLVNQYGALYKSRDMTSVHVNCVDQYMIASGHSRHVGVFDISTGRTVREYRDIHRESINVSRWGNVFPNIFLTCSFDKDFKLWDVRCPSAQNPVYRLTSDHGNVMCCFSPDDRHFLCSSIDNEVKQYETVDGRLNVEFQLPVSSGRTSRLSYTRSYYKGRDQIVTGSSSEDVIRVACSLTGQTVQEVSLSPGRQHPSLHVQSLRANPHHHERIAVLIFYRHVYGYEICDLDLSSSSSSNTSINSLRRLSSDLHAARLSSSGNTSDMLLFTTDDDIPHGAHSLILKHRWKWYAIHQHEKMLKVPCSSSSLVMILEYLYSDVVNTGHYNIHQLRSFYQQIRWLYLERMCDIIIADLNCRLSLDNAVESMRFAMEMSCSKLQIPCQRFICRHWIWFSPDMDMDRHQSLLDVVGIQLLKSMTDYTVNRGVPLPPGNDILSGRHGHCSVRVGHFVFIIGGISNIGPRDLDYIPLIDTRTNSWWILPTTGHMPTSLVFHTADVIGDAIYCIGGMHAVASSHRRRADQHHVQCYSLCLKTLSWSTVITSGDIPLACSRHASAAVPGRNGGQLWAYGGRQRGGTLNGMYRLDHLTSSEPIWSMIVTNNPSPPHRFGHTMTYCASQRALVILGGFVTTHLLPLDDIVLFHIDTMVWEKKMLSDGDIPLPRWGQTVTEMTDGSLVMIGGRTIHPRLDDDDDKTLSDTWRLCTESWQWSRMTSYGESPVTDHTAWVHPSSPHIVIWGGSTTSGDYASPDMKCLSPLTGRWSMLSSTMFSIGLDDDIPQCIAPSTLVSDLLNMMNECDREGSSGRSDCVRIRLSSGRILHMAKFIAEARSDLFRRMFSINMMECQTGEAILPDVNDDVAQYLVRYIYTGEFHTNQGHSLIESLIASRMMAVDSLTDDLQRALIPYVMADNVAMFTDLSDRHYLYNLRHVCRWMMNRTQAAHLIQST